MPERIPPRNPENISPVVPMEGLHGRFVLADQKFLKPDSDVKTEDLTKVTSFEERNYNPFEKASEKNRDAYWEHKGITSFNAQKDAWTNSLVGSFSSASSKATLEKLSPFLQKAGILTGNENEQFNADHAKKIYERYFDGDHPGGVKKFVADILETYQTNGTVDMNAINQNMQQISWLANVFGEEGKDMVTQLVAAEAKLKTTPDFVQKLATETDNKMRINNLNDAEKRILTFITDAQTADEHEYEEEAATPTGELPIMKHKEKLQDLIKNNDTVILVGGTGCGKTVKTPQFIREIMEPGDKLIVTEPRQINASSIAAHVAFESGVELGKEIGFKHGGDEKLDEGTTPSDTIFQTEGTLIQQIMNDKDGLLRGVSHVMVDEVHIRTKDTEKLLVFLKEIQKKRKAVGMKPLKIIAASATVDEEELKRYFDNAPVEKVPGRTYPITYHERPTAVENMPQESARIIKELEDSGKAGDVVIGVAGVRDPNGIEAHAKAIQQLNPDVKIFMVHSNTTQAEKDEIEKTPPPGAKRRVIIGTDFIQTGVTIKNLKFVINTGEVYVQSVDRDTGLTSVTKKEQSQAEIDQWSGRVGRTSPGDVYNLFSNTEKNRRLKFPKPEMQRTDLTDLVLQMKNRGVADIAHYPFLSAPLDEHRITFATETLKTLGALDDEGKITPIGERMVSLPTDYEYARMIAEAENNGGKGVKELCIIATLSEARSLFEDRNKAQLAQIKFKNPNSDFLTNLNIWNAYENTPDEEKEAWAKQNGINIQVLEKAKVAIDKLLKRAKTRGSSPATDDELGRYIFAGLRDKLMHYIPTRGSYLWERGHANTIHMDIGKDSVLSGKTPPYIVTGNNSPIGSRNGQRSVRLSNCQIVKPEWMGALPIAA